MGKQQIILIIAALATVAGLYFFGPVKGPDKPKTIESHADSTHEHLASLDIEKYQQAAIAKLSQPRQQYLMGLQASVKRGDVKAQSVHVFHELAAFWHDTVPDPLLHFSFVSQAAELDNSEKTLTFAAHSILSYLPFAQNQPEQTWLANKGKELFEKAVLVNPANDSSIVGVGACIIYGADAGEQGPMQGILKVREVAQRDSNNLFAQYMLGVGGMVSRQYDKAVLRFERVVKEQPHNLEALFKLAEAYELMNNKPMAAKWYQTIYTQVKDPGMKTELKKRIEELKK